MICTVNEFVPICSRTTSILSQDTGIEYRSVKTGLQVSGLDHPGVNRCEIREINCQRG